MGECERKEIYTVIIWREGGGEELAVCLFRGLYNNNEVKRDMG